MPMYNFIFVFVIQFSFLFLIKKTVRAAQILSVAYVHSAPMPAHVVFLVMFAGKKYFFFFLIFYPSFSVWKKNCRTHARGRPKL